jgi:hypothetical protein
MSARRADAAPAAIPIAAALTAVAARAVPIEFAYRENDLGIVSVATENRYPVIQETFWLAFGLILGAALVWTIARALAPRRFAARDAVALEAVSIAALAAVVALPAVIAEIVVLICAAAMAALVRRAAVVGMAEAEPAVRIPRTAISAALGGVAIVLVSLALTRGIWHHLWNVGHAVSDASVAVDNFKFLGETGQHLAWANALSHGWFQGRDVFCLYGPLYDLGLVGFWGIVGKSAAAWNLYWSLTRVLGWISLFALGGALVRNRASLLALPFLLPWIELRVGWALFAAWFLYRWLETDRRSWLVGCGAMAGVGILYSQEYGTAISIGAVAAFAVRRDLRAAALFVVTAAATVSPLLVYYAAHGALGPMLADVAQYPAYMIAGYGKLIFPALIPSLPLDWAAFGGRPSLTLRMSYAVPVVCLGAFLLMLPVSALDLRHPLRSLREAADGLARDPQRLMIWIIAIFGMIAFRSAMGRASLHRTHAALPAVALLLCVALDHALATWRDPSRRGLAVWRAVTLAALFAFVGFWQTSSPLSDSWRSLRFGVHLYETDYRPRGHANIARVTRYIREHTEANEPVLFLPNNGAYYYLTDRPNPIRFVMGHQMVGDAHRAEALDDLTARPPRYVVWDHHALRVDDLPDEKVFGPAILKFISDNYEIERRVERIDILRHKTLKQPHVVAEW